MKFNRKIFIRTLLGIAAGGILGFAYYYYFGCRNGCPIQSNPYASTIYGAILGGLFSFPAKRKNTGGSGQQTENPN